MKHTIVSSESKSLIQQLPGLKISKCLRHFTVGINEEVPIEIQEQESDGDTCLVFSNGLIVNFHAHTEEFSITMSILEVPTGGKCFVDVSDNAFWKTKIGIEINEVSFLNGDYRDNPYGIEFKLENNEKFEIIYISNNKWDFDLIVVR